ncbi:hypothetical protein [Methylobacterium sp. WL120]|uniref:hypothetical protein n=1 Tax=Methylobacterium sp. WL120 TaxID=2603887 RepID=UPI0011C8CF1C|nr:hypothetical protein [Methylobacterium sp. WL120]TXM68191.1 hypothetical protein FV229_08480 [Methylobacterium sp. WL120]
MSTVTVAVQKINMTEVTKIIVSDIVQDGTDFVRAIRYYGNETDTNGLVLLLETLSRSVNRSDLVIATPIQGF